MVEARLIYSALNGQYQTYIEDLHKRIATAATTAMAQAGAKLKIEARAHIAGAGFSKKWQNAFRVNLYPSKGVVSVSPAAQAFHKIPYAEVFETGATIAGNPLLWLPLPNVPTSIPGTMGGRVHMSPSAYIRSIGPLQYIARPGKPPLLAGIMEGGGAISVAKLKAGNRSGRPGAPGKKKVLVPLFFGISQVSLHARFQLRAIFAKAQASLGPLYAANFK
jgi:hypothetical protein